MILGVVASAALQRANLHGYSPIWNGGWLVSRGRHCTSICSFSDWVPSPRHSFSHAPCATRSDSRWRRSSRSSIQPLRGGIFRPMVTSGRQERRSRALVAFGARLFLVLGALVHLGWAARSNRRLLADRFGAKAADGALGLVVRAVRATLGRHGADVIQVARAGRELAHGGRRLNVTHTKEKQMISRHDLHDHRNAAE
jgi:hypothetical protein